MTQHINLYAREERPSPKPLLVSLALVAGFAIIMAMYEEMLRRDTRQLETRLAQTTSQLAAEKAAVKVMRDELAKRTDPARLAAELAALKTSAAEAQEIVNMVQRGELGTPDGYATHLVTLARIHEPGVWLTHLKVLNAGRTMEVHGRSLQAEGVLRYAGEVNKEFASQGASLTALEMTPVSTPNQSATAIEFKLF